MGNDAFYSRLGDTARSILRRYSTGTLVLLRSTPAEPAPETPWKPGVPTVVRVPVAGVAIPVQEKYVDGGLVVGNEKQVTIEHPGYEIGSDDGLEIDGVVHTVVRTLRRPEAGPAVAWTLFARA